MEIFITFSHNVLFVNKGYLVKLKLELNKLSLKKKKLNTRYHGQWETEEEDEQTLDPNIHLVEMFDLQLQM